MAPAKFSTLLWNSFQLISALYRHGMAYLLGDGALVVEGGLIAPLDEVSVDALLGDVKSAVWEPLVEVEVADSQGGFGESTPSHELGLFLPVVDGVCDGAGEGRLVGAEVATKTR